MNESDELFPEGRLSIASSPFKRWQMVARTIASGGLVLIGLLLWYSQDETWAKVAAFLAVLVAILLPHKCDRYLAIAHQTTRGQASLATSGYWDCCKCPVSESQQAMASSLIRIAFDNTHSRR